MNFKEFESAEKLRGCYYTDSDIASFLTRWVWQIKPKSILEPSCGYGVFLETTAQLLTKNSALKSLTGFEIDSEDAKEALSRANLLKDIDVDIKQQNFLSWALGNFSERLLKRTPCFDAVLGNPPFIRYQYLDNYSQVCAKGIFEAFNLKFTMHTNAWVPFVISSIALLKPGGRLAMVVPSEILHVLHAYSLRFFLTSQCSKILIFDPEELWFKDVLQGAVLLLAEKKVSTDVESRGVAIIRTKTRSFLKDDPESYFKEANYVNGEVLSGIKWMRALLTDKERSIVNAITKSDKVFQFKDIADVDVGIVTGANKFFLVNDSVVDRYDLSNWAHPMFGRSEHVKGVVYDNKNHLSNKKRGLPTNFIWFRENDKKLNGLPKEYISLGEREAFHNRYKCRIRNPWYAVPSVYASPVGMLKRCHDYPRLIFNRIKALTTDTAYRIKTKSGTSPTRLVYSFINSLTALCSELEGRHYGGGVLELVPSEIERIYIPLPQVQIQLHQLDNDIKNGINYSDLLPKQDETLLKGVGLNANDRDIIYSAWLRLRNRRQRNGK